MIYVKRGREPKLFRDPEIHTLRERLRKATHPVTQQPLFEDPLPAFMREVAQVLAETFKYKCAYCESHIPAATFAGHVDHFRPQGALGLDGKKSQHHYDWLVLEWENLYWACAACNALKAKRFPIKNPRASIGAKGKALQTEEPLLLDPCGDDPESELEFTPDGKVKGRTQRAWVTVEVLGLNRTELVRNRLAEINRLQTALATLQRYDDPRALADLLDPDQPYLACKWQMLHLLAPEGLDLGPAVQALERTVKTLETTVAQQWQKLTAPTPEVSSVLSTKGEFHLSARFIERIEIENFRNLARVDIAAPLVTEGAPWTMLLGENGTGKSSVLYALALALMGDGLRHDLKLDAGQFLRHGAKSGYIRLTLTNRAEAPIELRFNAKAKKFVEVGMQGPPVLLLAYGATRLMDRKKHRLSRNLVPPRPIHAQNLFDPFAPLQDARGWLLTRTEAEFKAATTVLAQLLSPEATAASVEFKRTGRTKSQPPQFKIKFPVQDAWLLPTQLSDGYQTMLALAVDIMRMLSAKWADYTNAEGVMLIDELSAHLHPRWQMRVVTSLRQAFPRVQFFATTHDPLCLRGLRQGEIVVLRADAGGKIAAQSDLPDPLALDANQLLASEHFGLFSTVDPAVEALFEEYYQLLALAEHNPAQAERLAALQKQLQDKQAFGATPREQIALEVIDRHLAKKLTLFDPTLRAAVEAQMRAEAAARLAETAERLPEADA